MNKTQASPQRFWCFCLKISSIQKYDISEITEWAKLQKIKSVELEYSIKTESHEMKLSSIKPNTVKILLKYEAINFGCHLDRFEIPKPWHLYWELVM